MPKFTRKEQSIISSLKKSGNLKFAKTDSIISSKKLSNNILRVYQVRKRLNKLISKTRLSSIRDKSLQNTDFLSDISDITNDFCSICGYKCDNIDGIYDDKYDDEEYYNDEEYYGKINSTTCMTRDGTFVTFSTRSNFDDDGNIVPALRNQYSSWFCNDLEDLRRMEGCYDCGSQGRCGCDGESDYDDIDCNFCRRIGRARCNCD